MASSVISLTGISKTNRSIHNEEDILDVLPKLMPCLSSHLVVERISGGITNQIFKVSHATNEKVNFLLRIFGSADVFSPSQRARENAIFAQLAQVGIAPELHAVFANGRVEQYYDARPITLDEMTTDVVCDGVAKAMARMHSFKPTGIPAEVRVWHDIDAWSKVAVRLSEKDMLGGHVNVQKGLEWIEVVQKRLAKQSSPVVYAHNDLLCGNILLSAQNEVRIVDFEYCSFNYRGFDIANFFSECMGGTSDGIIHPDKYPSLDFRIRFCETYLLERGEEATEGAVRELVHESEEFELLTHLYWGFWGLVQCGSSTVNFPYAMFAEGRFAEFLKRFNR